MYQSEIQRDLVVVQYSNDVQKTSHQSHTTKHHNTHHSNHTLLSTTTHITPITHH